MSIKIPSTSFNDIHKNFVTTEDGTTLAELLQVLGSISLTTFLVPLLIPWIVPPSFTKQAIHDEGFYLLIRTVVEYPVIAVFPILVVTIFAGQSIGLCSGIVLVSLLTAACGIILVNHAITAPRWSGLMNQWERIKNMPTGWATCQTKKFLQNSRRNNKLVFVTNYRAIVIYITVLCILAVDFPIFPRRFSKTKDFGISLMDVGTGCFVFANGIVSPEARGKRSPLYNSLKSTLPIIILGFLRLITVKGIEYQEVVEEYGVHWNFFFTLAGVKIWSSLLFTMFDPANGLKLAAATSILQELILTYNNLQTDYILNPVISRSGSLIDANREGIFSVLGYVAIYLASVYFGKLIYWKSRVSISDWLDYACRTVLQLAILWATYFLVATFGNSTCRRAANLNYILLTVSLNYFLLWLQMILALLQVCLQHLGLIYGPIVFYELAALQEREAERLKNLLHMKKYKKDVVQNKVDSENLDEKLKQLDEQLQETFQKVKQRAQDSSVSEACLNSIASIENELETLEIKLNKHSCDAEDQVTDSKDEERTNVVEVPNLSKSPVILEAICYNGLVVFLLGNVLTGLINCTTHTMYATTLLSLCYLWSYVTVITAFSVILFCYKVQLKFW